MMRFYCWIELSCSRFSSFKNLGLRMDGWMESLDSELVWLCIYVSMYLRIYPFTNIYISCCAFVDGYSLLVDCIEMVLKGGLLLSCLG